METQQQKILNHLREHGSITSWEAIVNYHATRLSGVIFNLRKQGYHISSTIESEDGKHFARYRLEAEQ